MFETAFISVDCACRLPHVYLGHTALAEPQTTVLMHRQVSLGNDAIASRKLLLYFKAKGDLGTAEPADG